jgi:hypothetical protein
MRIDFGDMAVLGWVTWESILHSSPCSHVFCGSFGNIWVLIWNMGMDMDMDMDIWNMETVAHVS